MQPGNNDGPEDQDDHQVFELYNCQLAAYLATDHFPSLLQEGAFEVEIHENAAKAINDTPRSDLDKQDVRDTKIIHIYSDGFHVESAGPRVHRVVHPHDQSLFATTWAFVAIIELR